MHHAGRGDRACHRDRGAAILAAKRSHVVLYERRSESAMADVRPFPGIRYADAAHLANLTTPPYDVIAPEALERYYARDPHNIIRLELGKVAPGDDDLDNVYTRAAATFAEWRLHGVLRQDAPALYLYEQGFAVAGRDHPRRAPLARVRLGPWEGGGGPPPQPPPRQPKGAR